MAANMLAFSVTLICYIMLSINAVPLPQDGSAPNNKSNFNETGPQMISPCINELSEGVYRPAANCKNGRGMAGCCIDRVYCDFNTSHIDLTLYGPRGYKDPCDTKYVCCPKQYALPIFVDDDTSDLQTDPDFVDDNNDESHTDNNLRLE